MLAQLFERGFEYQRRRFATFRGEKYSPFAQVQRLYLEADGKFSLVEQVPAGLSVVLR